MNEITTLNVFDSCPSELREIFKLHRKVKLQASGNDSLYLDTDDLGKERLANVVSFAGEVHSNAIESANAALGHVHDHPDAIDVPSSRPCTVFESNDLPGLRIYPKLLSPVTQMRLLSCLLHTELASDQNKTNVHAHHALPYDAIPRGSIPQIARSFFSLAPDSIAMFQPHSRKSHEPFSISQFFQTKLRWLTLGAQYDWTLKQYTSAENTFFPTDLQRCLESLFPGINFEAGIVNVYSPGDNLSMHRDVSEECSEPLVSVSLGCDGIFVAGLPSTDGETCKHISLRLHSGDVLYLGETARFAWHGVPQVVPNTTPEMLRNWPSVETVGASEHGAFAEWKGWMANKRVNLSVRQVLP